MITEVSTYYPPKDPGEEKARPPITLHVMSPEGPDAVEEKALLKRVIDSLGIGRPDCPLGACAADGSYIMFGPQNVADVERLLAAHRLPPAAAS